MKQLLLAWLTCTVVAYAQFYTPPREGGCTETTIKATGRTQIAETGSAPMSYTGSYRTTGSPTGVSVAIEAGNAVAATQTPFGKIAAVTNTSGADLGTAAGSYRKWFVNVATLSGGTSPTIVLTSCFAPWGTALSSVTGTGTGTGAQQVQGTAAHGAASVGNPVYVAGRTAAGNVNDLTMGVPGGSPLSVPLVQNQGLLLSMALNALYPGTGTVAEYQLSGLRVTGAGVSSVVNADDDPCQTSGRAKSMVAITAGSTDTELVAAVGGQHVYVCGVYLTNGAATATWRLISGTGSVCATGLSGRTGAFAGIGPHAYGSGGATIARTNAASDALCIDVGGTSPDAQGVLGYVQK
jgi:hypothetical protein